MLAERRPAWQCECRVGIPVSDCCRSWRCLARKFGRPAAPPLPPPGVLQVPCQPLL